MTADPLRPPETDEEPWSLPPADPRLMGDDDYGPSRQRWALILAVAGVAAIVLLLGGTRV